MARLSETFSFSNKDKEEFLVINIQRNFIDYYFQLVYKYEIGDKMKFGLSSITEACFGKPLSIKQCMSNWNQRPLTEAQLKYAALDAFVLIQIHDYMQNQYGGSCIVSNP